MTFIDEVKVLPDVTTCEYPKNTYIYKQGEGVDFVYYLVQGLTCRTLFAENGEETIYQYYDGPEFLGAMPIVTEEDFIRYNIMSKSSCVGYKIPKEVFKAYADCNPRLLKVLLVRVFNESNHVTRMHVHMKQGKMGNKVCQLFLERAVERRGKLVVPKNVTYVELAKYLGIHHVTLSRILRFLNDEGIIIKTRKSIILSDLNRLTRFAEGEKMLYK